jgi:hypothetical protein
MILRILNDQKSRLKSPSLGWRVIMVAARWGFDNPPATVSPINSPTSMLCYFAEIVVQASRLPPQARRLHHNVDTSGIVDMMKSVQP